MSLGGGGGGGTRKVLNLVADAELEMRRWHSTRRLEKAIPRRELKDRSRSADESWQRYRYEPSTPLQTYLRFHNGNQISDSTYL